MKIIRTLLALFAAFYLASGAAAAASDCAGRPTGYESAQVQAPGSAAGQDHESAHGQPCRGHCVQPDDDRAAEPAHVGVRGVAAPTPVVFALYRRVEEARRDPGVAWAAPHSGRSLAILHRNFRN